MSRKDDLIWGNKREVLMLLFLLQTTGQLLDLQQSVYCLDNDHRGSHPRVAIGSQNYIYIVREEKKASWLDRKTQDMRSMQVPFSAHGNFCGYLIYTIRIFYENFRCHLFLFRECTDWKLLWFHRSFQS